MQNMTYYVLIKEDIERKTGKLQKELFSYCKTMAGQDDGCFEEFGISFNQPSSLITIFPVPISKP